MISGLDYFDDLSIGKVFVFFVSHSFLVVWVKEVTRFQVDDSHVLLFKRCEQLFRINSTPAIQLAQSGSAGGVLQRSFEIVHHWQKDLDVFSQKPFSHLGVFLVDTAFVIGKLARSRCKLSRYSSALAWSSLS